ncbi:MAG: PEP-utilizing enzyme [Clostridia bacterium]|nr:PEP-utilizing enzyme [Clostridia bacterium]
MKLICQGKSVTQGTAVGSVIAVTDVDSALENTNKNTILLLDNSDPIYCLLIMKAGGVIIKEGGVLAHTCLLAMEIGIPCITQVGHETVINNGQTVYLDAGAGNVYEC